MKKLVIGLLIVAVLGLTAFFIFRQDSWQTYENARYQFSVDYPAGWQLGEAPVNNDGREFISPDGSITCRAYGFQNALMNEDGEPQSLDEFVGWLTENLDIESVLETQDTNMADQTAKELITKTEGIVSQAVYIMGRESGRGLVCYYPDSSVKDSFQLNFRKMQSSFEITTSLDGEEVIAGTEECVNLLNGAIEPYRDVQIFEDTNYTEVTSTSREYWDKGRLPDKVSQFERQDYTCYPMPLEFDYLEAESEVLPQPAVKEVQWTCELAYDAWQYAADYDLTKTAELKNQGYVCQKEGCFDGAESSHVWLCTK